MRWLRCFRFPTAFESGSRDPAGTSDRSVEGVDYKGGSLPRLECTHTQARAAACRIRDEMKLSREPAKWNVSKTLINISSEGFRPLFTRLYPPLRGGRKCLSIDGHGTPLSMRGKKQPSASKNSWQDMIAGPSGMAAVKGWSDCCPYSRNGVV